jgi:RNA polymerase sigma-70 factor (ECF subfamily)
MSEIRWTLAGPVGSMGLETDWFVVSAAGQGTAESADATEKLCFAYWYPLYAYARRRGYPPADAQDLTQEFFARLLGRGWLRSVHPSKGKFQSFLLASMNHFLANDWRDQQRQKRGGGREDFSLDAVAAEELYRFEPLDEESPDKLFDRRWAKLLLERVLAQLEAECRAPGKSEMFFELKGILDGEGNLPRYVDVAARLRMTEAAVKKAAQRLRTRYSELLRAEVAQTLTDQHEVDEEIRYLFSVLRG